MRNVICMAVVLLCSSCALIMFQPPWPRVNDFVLNAAKPVRDYAVQQPISVSVGSKMLGAYVYSSTVTYYQPTTNQAYFWLNEPIDSSQIWTPVYRFNEGKPQYIISSYDYFHRNVGIIIDYAGNVADNPVLRIDDYGSTKRYPYDGPKGKLFEKVVEPAPGADRFKFELIYSGKTGNNLSLMYREFNNDFARTAFYQTINYNLDESSIIEFKDMTIEIVDATNSKIRFKVLADNDLSWMPYQQ